MNNILIINLLTGLAILFSLIIFHRITFYIFTPAIDFFDVLFSVENRKILFEEIEINPSFAVGYIIPIFIEYLIAAISILLLNTFGFATTINNVVFISIIPCLISYLFVIIVGLIQNYINPSFSNYKIPIYKQQIRILFVNTVIITLGGLTGILLTKFFT